MRRLRRSLRNAEDRTHLALAQPFLIEDRHLELGRGGEVRLCEYTNYCEGLDQNHKQVTCKLWDRTNLDEPGIRLASDGKRRLTAPEWQR